MLPLSGHTLSSTGVPNSEIDAIQRAVKGLGGEFLANLGEKTLSFLIVGRRWSEKYNFCALHSTNTFFISPQTLLEAQTLYKRGDPVEVVEYLIKNRVPVFEGLKITISSLPIEQEKEIANLVTSHGGTFTRTLNRECDVVIAESCKGKRAKFAQQWDKAVVVQEWVSCSIKRGVALPTNEYLTRDSEMGTRQLTADPIIGAHSTVQESTTSKEPDKESRMPTGNTVIDSVDSLQDSVVVDFKAGPKRKKTAEYDDLFVPKAPKPAANKPTLTRSISQGTEAPSAGVLSGITFSIHGFDARETEILHKTIYSHDGEIQSPSDFLIVNSKLPIIPEPADDATIITEWAIERSLYKKCATLTDIWGTPVYHQGIGDFKGLKICLSGYKDMELVHMERLVKMLGAELCTSLTVDRDILISSSRQAQKFKYAKVWRIPIVTGQWLWDCAKEGKIVDITEEHSLDGLGARAAPMVQKVIAPAEGRGDFGIEAAESHKSGDTIAEATAYVEYGSDEDSYKTPIGRNFVKKSAPIRRSKRRA